MALFVIDDIYHLFMLVLSDLVALSISNDVVFILNYLGLFVVGNYTASLMVVLLQLILMLL